MHFIKFIIALIFCLPISLWGETTLHNMDGQQIPFHSLKGKWVFINYWASWCQSCINEIPELNRFYEKNSHQVALFSVNYDALPLSKQQKLIQKFSIHYPSLSEDPKESLRLGEIRGVPITFVFNPEGELLVTLYGQQTDESLHHIIASN